MFVDQGLEVKADPFSLESLIAWLEKQPADASYNFYDNCGCMLHQYFTAHGLQNVSVGGMSLDIGEEKLALPDSFRASARGVTEWNWTFGAALNRAREALAKR